MADFRVKALVFDGAGEVRLTGARIVLAEGGVMLSNNCATVEIENPLRVEATGRFALVSGRVDILGAMAIQDGQTLTIDGCDANPDSLLRLAGGVVGPQATLVYGLGRNVREPHVHTLDSAVKVKRLAVGSGWRNCILRVRAAGQDWQETEVGYGTLVADAANVFGTVTRAVSRSYYATAYWNLNGFDQTIDRFYAGEAGAVNDQVEITSDEPATLTMHATGDGWFGGRVTGRVSLCWAPEAVASTLVITNVSPTTGDLTVSNGTVALRNRAALAALQHVTVATGATLALETMSAGALAGARTLSLDGTVAVSAATPNPFSGIVVTLGENGRFDVPQDCTVVVGAVRRGGGWLPEGAVSEAAWVTGGGIVRIDASTLPNGFEWKDAADGAWSVGANWRGGKSPDGTAPVRVEAAGADYTVALSADANLCQPLTVGNASGRGVATVSVSGRVEMPGASALHVVRGGRLAIPAEQSLALASASTVDGETRVLEIVDGGEMVVAGEFRADAFHGRIAVSGGGRLAIDGGLFTYTAYSSETGEANTHRLDLGAGGVLEVVSGTFFPRTSMWGNSALSFSGGTMNVTGTGEFRLAANTLFTGGAGRLDLSGQAVLRVDEDGAANLALEATGHEDAVFDIRVADSAAFALKGKGTVDIGNCRWNVSRGATVRAVFDSTADNFLGMRFSLGINQRNDTRAETEIRRGRVFVGNDGVRVSWRNTPANKTDAARGACLTVSGGQFLVDGRNCGRNGPVDSLYYFAGFGIAHGLPWDEKTSARQKGDVILSGGIISNLNGRVAVGAGFATGTFRQSGGVFWSGCTARPALIGVVDGEGRWKMTGGEAHFSESVYVGVGRTAEGTSETPFPIDVGTHALGNEAKGLLDIEGGSFVSDGDLVLGTDGNSGRVMVGPTGVVTARDLVMSNATDTITVRIDGPHAGAICLSGRLDVAAGVKLRILGAETILDGARAQKILSFASMTRPFAVSDIEVADGLRVIQAKTSIRVGRARGMCLVVR